MRVRAALLVGAIAASLPVSAAQSQRAFCFWPHPLPKCRTHLVFEFDATHALASTSGQWYPGEQRSDYASHAPNESSPIFSGYDLSIGAMKNQDESQATGIVASFALDQGGLPTRLELRRHHWIGEGGLSLSGGLVTRNIHRSEGTFNTLGLTAGAGIESPYVGLNARAEVSRGGGRIVSGILVGANSTTRTTPLVGLVAATYRVLAILFIGAAWRHSNV